MVRTRSGLPREEHRAGDAERVRQIVSVGFLPEASGTPRRRAQYRLPRSREAAVWIGDARRGIVAGRSVPMMCSARGSSVRGATRRTGRPTPG